MRKSIFRKGWGLGILFLFVTASILSALNVNPSSHSTVTNGSNWLYVGGSGQENYTKIQDAINDSSDGDTVFVYDDSSPYYEQTVIDKSINVLGENKNTTVIDGCKTGDAVCIKSEGVVLSNFTITHGDGDDPFKDLFKAGIRITSSNITIQDNIIRDNRIGILGLRVTNITICDNFFYHDGITFSPYENEGRPPILEKYFIHTIKNNFVNGKPLYYFKHQDNIEVPSDVGQLIAINCNNLAVRNASLNNVDNAGIILAYCSQCIIENSTFSENGEAWIFCSDHNIIQFNTMFHNLHGICLDYGSKYNIIKSNNISNNQLSGVMLEYYSNKNIIIKNNFIKNEFNGYPQQSFKNKWNENYWHDWMGLQYSFLRLSPKIILGQLVEGILLIPLINFDWHPVQEPYDIP